MVIINLTLDITPLLVVHLCVYAHIPLKFKFWSFFAYIAQLSSYIFFLIWHLQSFLPGAVFSYPLGNLKNIDIISSSNAIERIRR
jgi:hypothetical protein